MGYAHPMEKCLDDLGTIEGDERNLSSSQVSEYAVLTRIQVQSIILNVKASKMTF